MIRISPQIIVLMTLVMLAVQAAAYEDVASGKILAQRWCAECHLVAPGQMKAMADVPPFATIAARSDEELDKLPGFLTDPHPKMPNMNLTRQEIADIVGYIRSLR